MFTSLLSRSRKEALAIKFPVFYGVLNALRKKSRKLTFSQCGEDLVLLKYLPESNGMYVDVGAGHPVIGSNTYLLDKKRYTGIIVEPIAKFSQEFYRRKCVKQVFETVCAPVRQNIDFYEFENSFLSTTSKAVAEELLSSGEKLLSSRQLVSLKLSELGVSANPYAPSILDIDVEGVDLEVLKSNDWSTFRPRVILIESQLAKRDEIQQYLEKFNYDLKDVCNITLVFVSRDYIEQIA